MFVALIALHETHENMHKNVKTCFHSDFYAIFYGAVTLLLLSDFHEIFTKM